MSAIATVCSAGAAEQALLQPVSLDHVNIHVSNVARSAAFYMGLFDTPVLRIAALPARPNSPPSEIFTLKFGDGGLAISQAFAPDVPGLDHYSVGLRDYEQAKLAAKLQDSGVTVEAVGVVYPDIWARGPDGNLIQLRAPSGWARAPGSPYQAPARVGPALSPLSISRIALRSADLPHAGDFYRKLFGTEIASAASGRSRAFGLGDSVLELVSLAANAAPSARTEMDHFRIAVMDFNAETIARMLRDRGIDSAVAASGVVRLADPDGIAIELAAS